MKIEVNPKRILIEATTAEEESALKEFIEYSNFNNGFRQFLGVEPLPLPKAAMPRMMTKEEADAYHARLGRFMTVIEMHGFNETLFDTIRFAMEAVGRAFAQRGMIVSCSTSVMGGYAKPPGVIPPPPAPVPPPEKEEV